MSGILEKPLLELLGLPNEIISHILTFCDSVPPSLLSSQSEPVRPSISPDAITPLKEASILSHCIRRLALPLLFRNIYVTIEHLDALVAFTKSHNLNPHVITAQVFLSGPSTHRQPFWWSVLLTHFPRLQTLTIIAPPSVFAEITSQPIKLTDQWAFKIPFQTIQLSLPLLTIQAPPDRSTSNTTSLLTALPWTSLLINESSSLPAYTTYEYFLRHTPSPLAPSPSPAALHLYHHLTHFTYTAIFPTYNHVAEVLDIASEHMPDLRCLTVKLLPDPSSTILQETLEKAGYHFDVNDPWNEFETSLTLVGAAVVAMSQGREGHVQGHRVGGKLGRLEVQDVAMEGVRDIIETTVTGLLGEHQGLGWGYEGGGIWRRRELVVEGT
jgi:hypothetical protein